MLLLIKSADNRGEQYGGKYVARVSIGMNKDNKPKYRYFKTLEEYKAYIAGKNKPVKPKKKESDKKDLKDKLKQEHKKKPGPEKKPSLFLKVKDKKDKDKDE